MKEIQKKNDTDLKTFIGEKREELRKIRFGSAGSGTRNTRERRNTRKDVARGLTEVNKRVREAQSNNE